MTDACVSTERDPRVRPPAEGGAIQNGSTLRRFKADGPE